MSAKVRMFFVAALLSCLLSACTSSNVVSSVRTGTLEEWGPIAIEDQLKFWDCSTINWQLEKEHSAFTTVTATCKSVTRTALNSKLRTSICLNSIEYKHHCLDLFEVDELIKLRFAHRSDGRIDLLEASEQRIKDGKVVSDQHFSLSFLAQIRDLGLGSPELAYADLEDLEEQPHKVDMIWNELILGASQDSFIKFEPFHIEIANLIRKRLKEIYSPGELAYSKVD